MLEGRMLAPAPAGASLPRLVEIMDRLLAPDGCPWDREQTLETLRPFLVEETYEVLDAMGRDDAADHCEELGDLMMQIVFQSAIRAREGKFTIDDTIASISDKLVRRHPHVFGDNKVTGVDTPAQVLAQWEDIKKAEKAEKGEKRERILDGVKHGPALWRAQKLGAKAGKVGFDWPGWKGSHDKVQEEVHEIAAVADSEDQAAKHHEIGDLLLAVVNLARKLKVDAEVALVDATHRFTSRFEHIEDALIDRGKTPQTSSLEEMDALWNDAKAIEKARVKP
jgi:MazG family protein